MYMYTISQLAKLSGVTIRALHHYDHIGLLHPLVIKENGYRYYGENEITRLQQILFFRELDFPLSQIKEVITSPSFDEGKVLEDQKKLLEIRKKRLEEIIATIDYTKKNLKGGGNMSNDDKFGAFSDEELKKYQEEAKKRWGHTEAYKQSVDHTKNWTKKDYEMVKKEGEEITQSIAMVSDKGIGSKEIQALIVRHYKYISEFYDAPYEMYRNLGKMYVEDTRFTAYYDKFKKGLAVFMRDAIAYYCNTHEGK